MSKEKSVRIKSAILPEDYAAWVASLKKRIFGARQKALLAANTEQIKLYHDIGREILDRQNRQGWGAKVIDRLSADLREAFPDMKGLSASNLKYMRFFAQECPDCAIGQQSADQLPWFHIVILITKITDPSAREFYAREAVHQSWPRETLEQHITIGLLLCRTKKKMVAEYALSGIDKPMGVAEYQLVRSLPQPLDTCLPSIEELESHLFIDLKQNKGER